MAGPGQHISSGHHGQHTRISWNQPEESCGGFITTLPGPRGKSIWMAVGPVAQVWQNEPSSPILTLVKKSKTAFRSGISLFVYMVGRDQSTASPRIIFCSQDIAARKTLRKAVEASGILKDYPSIGLGDASSPLARKDSGLRRHGLDPSMTKLGDHTNKLGETQELGRDGQQSHYGSVIASETNIAAGSSQSRQDGHALLINHFGGMSISEHCPAVLSNVEPQKVPWRGLIY